MRIVPLDGKAAGLRLGRSLTDYRGNVLLHAGVTLTPHYIGGLRERGYRSVPVFDPFAPDAVPSDAIRSETREAAAAAVERALTQVRAGGTLSVPTVRRVIDQILSDIAADPDLACNVSTLRSLGDNPFTHSVNVCVFSAILARSLALETQDVRRLCLGALLHDIGNIYFLDLVTKSSPLTAEEADILKRHTLEGYRLLRDQRGVHLFSAHIALQHHERLDGSGYPRGLRGKEIHLWSQVVAVADAYDTMTGGQQGAAGLPPHEAMAQLALQSEAGRVEARFVRHLIQRLAAFPEGTIVLLQTGEVAVVTAQTGLGGQHPVVRVMSDPRLHLVEAVERSLDSAAPETSVRSVLSDYPALLYEQIRAARRA